MLCIDPAPYTLRKLKLLADGKRRHDYDVAISLACYVSAVFSGKFKPDQANPYRNYVEDLLESKASMTDEQRKEQHKDMMQNLGMWLAQIPGATSG